MGDRQTIRDQAVRSLSSQLKAGGLALTVAEKRTGVHFIAQFERKEDKPRFCSCSIRMMATAKPRFGLDKKCASIPNLLLVYVWNPVSHNETVILALTYQEALVLLSTRRRRDHTNTMSWKVLGGYSIPDINDEWDRLLEPYRMNAEAWKPKILSVC